uniref:Uncharacterized protein n=1 Tax=Timema monikensis TaxID=170555 RepID=A0A7R9HMD5_9NEOP|nr:unnamed protein product [Timema monikensis]
MKREFTPHRVLCCVDYPPSNPTQRSHSSDLDVVTQEPATVSAATAEPNKSPYFGRKRLDEESGHSRRASEKVKKRMKMADLRAFVETKLMSKSEKTLEKIGTDEPKVLYGQEYHRSLDTGEEHLSRPSSAFAKIFETKSEQDKIKHPSNLVKGKSMPSLSIRCDRSLEESCPHHYGMSTNTIRGLHMQSKADETFPHN